MSAASKFPMKFQFKRKGSEKNVLIMVTWRDKSASPKQGQNYELFPEADFHGTSQQTVLRTLLLTAESGIRHQHQSAGDYKEACTIPVRSKFYFHLLNQCLPL